MPEVACLVAARPNFVKMAPVVRALLQGGRLEPVLIHAGQHYDRPLDEFITTDLAMAPPRHHLGVGSGSHAFQSAETMLRLEPILEDEQFAGLLVAGDVNATMAGALVAAKLLLPLAHLEAGLRSRDRTMPEEINRIVTDTVAEICLTPSRDADENLLAEGIPSERIHFVGNTMIDSLDTHLDEARGRQIAASFGLESGAYGVATIHRPSNVDSDAALARTLETLGEVADLTPLLFPAHPRTLARIEETGYRIPPNLEIIEPLGYIDFLSLVATARLVLTDSGGIQEETTVLGVPCLTMRENTERPITISEGSNRLVGTESAAIIGAVKETLARPMPSPSRPEGWDGQAGERVAALLEDAWG